MVCLVCVKNAHSKNKNSGDLGLAICESLNKCIHLTKLNSDYAFWFTMSIDTAAGNLYSDNLFGVI